MFLGILDAISLGITFIIKGVYGSNGVILPGEEKKTQETPIQATD